MAVDLPDSSSVRAHLAAKGWMFEWPKGKPVKAGYNPQDVQEVCVQNAAWQKTRLSMKGKPTHEKLQICYDWWVSYSTRGATLDDTEIQVGNYLGALRRGGQLNDNNQVRKYI